MKKKLPAFTLSLLGTPSSGLKVFKIGLLSLCQKVFSKFSPSILLIKIPASRISRAKTMKKKSFPSTMTQSAKFWWLRRLTTALRCGLTAKFCSMKLPLMMDCGMLYGLETSNCWSRTTWRFCTSEILDWKLQLKKSKKQMRLLFKSVKNLHLLQKW